MSIWTYGGLPVSFGGGAATFGARNMTTYGNEAAIVQLANYDSQFNTNATQQQSLIPADAFTLTETTNFSTILAGVRINNGTSGNCELLLWNSSSGVPTTLVAITGNVAVPDTSGDSLPVLVSADVTGLPLFQNVPAGEYTLSCQANGEGIRIASSTLNSLNFFYALGANVDTPGGSWSNAGNNKGSLIIYIQGSPAPSGVEVTFDLTHDLTHDLTFDSTG